MTEKFLPNSIENYKDKIIELFDIEDQTLRSHFDTYCRINGKQISELPKSIRPLLLAVHKILFLTGGKEGDVITATDPWNNHIYTGIYGIPGMPVDENDPNFREDHPIKTGEIGEALVAISQFNQEESPGSLDKLSEALSEISDVVFNLLHLQMLDPGLNVMLYINNITKRLGYTEEQMLELVYTKYLHRYTIGKDISKENELISKKILSSKLPKPTKGKFSRCYNAIFRTSEDVIKPRLGKLIYDIDLQTESSA